MYLSNFTASKIAESGPGFFLRRIYIICFRILFELSERKFEFLRAKISYDQVTLDQRPGGLHQAELCDGVGKPFKHFSRIVNEIFFVTIEPKLFFLQWTVCAVLRRSGSPALATLHQKKVSVLLKAQQGLSLLPISHKIRCNYTT